MQNIRRHLMAHDSTAPSPSPHTHCAPNDREDDHALPSSSRTSTSRPSGLDSHAAYPPSHAAPGSKKYKAENRPKTKMIDIPSLSPASLHANPASVIPRTPLANAGHVQVSPPKSSLTGALVASISPPTLDVPSLDIDEAAANFPDIAKLPGKDLITALEGLLAQDVEIDYDVSAARLPGMNVDLKPYQIQGVNWMRQRESGRYKGGILADDMGLGKTIQTLALIVSNHPKNEEATIHYSIRDEDLAKAKRDKSFEIPRSKVELRSDTTLIVAPVAVMRQWESEISTRSNANLKVLIHHGPTKAASASVLKDYDIVITSYNTAASELDDMPKSHVLLRMRWLRIVLDEAHTIKNHTTKAAQACFAMSDRCHSRWCLTGTPIQNTALDLFSLIHFLDIPPFNDLKHFKDKILKPIASLNQNSVNWGMKRLLVVTNAILLRRQKDALFDGKPLITLPDRNVEIVVHPFDNDVEADFYASWQQQARKNAEQESSAIGKLVILLRLRQAADHPALISRKLEAKDVLPSLDSGGKKNPKPQLDSKAPAEVDELDELADMMSSTTLTTVSCQRCHGRVEVIPGIAPAEMCSDCAQAVKVGGADWSKVGSTKIRMMIKVLKQIREAGEEKTVIFSQFTSFMDLIGDTLTAEGYLFVRYDGSMSAAERARVLSQFTNTPSIKVAVMSLKAAAVGINVTCASRVIFTDVWWNPTTQDQAIDRAHRIGQERAVTAYILAISGTVEERIIALQEKKRALARAALEGTKLKKGTTKLSKEELDFLFNGGNI